MNEPSDDTTPAGMTWTVLDCRYALVGLEGAAADEDVRAALAGAAGHVVVDGDETTLLLPEEAAADVLARHPDARCEHDLAWIRFDAPMAWDVVGFLACVTSRLAAAGVPLGAVCGYGRDHLFVAARYLETARRELRVLFPESE